MRWERLFDDLEAQLDAQEAAELAAEVDERGRAEAGRLTLAERLRAGVGYPLALGVRGVGRLRGEATRVGTDYVVVVESSGRELLVGLGAVTWITGLPGWSVPQPAGGRVAGRLGLRHLLRALARERAQVGLTCVDGEVVSGIVRRVGADFVELGPLPGDRRGEPLTTVALDAVAAAVTAPVGG